MDEIRDAVADVIHEMETKAEEEGNGGEGARRQRARNAARENEAISNVAGQESH